MATKGPWLLALALDLLVDDRDEDDKVSALVGAAQGSREALRGAYARALALAGELPGDVQARRLVDLLSRAMRWSIGPSQMTGPGGSPSGWSQASDGPPGDPA